MRNAEMMKINEHKWNNETEKVILKQYTTEELIEIGKKAAYRNIESEMPTTEEYNEEKGIFTIYRIIYK